MSTVYIFSGAYTYIYHAYGHRRAVSVFYSDLYVHRQESGYSLDSGFYLSSICQFKKQSRKACFLYHYFSKSHLDCYQFCKQYEDHFDMHRAKKDNRTLFAVSFLLNGINTCWPECKRRHVQEKKLDVVLLQEEFKAFPRDNCGNWKSFVKDIWNKLRGDSQY